MVRIAEIPHSESIGRTLMLLTQTARIINKYVDSYFYHKAPTSFTKFLVLKTIASSNGVMTQTQIAKWTQTELHNITTLIRRMKKEDLISTGRSNTDKRIISVLLTEKGRMVLKQALPVANELIKEIKELSNYNYIQPEFNYEKTRFDFLLRNKYEKCLLEVKSYTPIKSGLALFPDTKTAR